MKYHVIPVGSIEANCSILWSDTNEAWIIDPGADADKIHDFCENHGLTPVLIALTHGHFDHKSALPDLTQFYPNIPIHLHPEDRIIAFHPENKWLPYYPATTEPDHIFYDLTENFLLTAGGLEARILHTPGHTPGSICFYFEKDNLLLSGDTLFAGSCGRTDLPGGNEQSLHQSLNRLSKLPPSTTVITGHGVSTTIERENTYNPFLR